MITNMGNSYHHDSTAQSVTTDIDITNAGKAAVAQAAQYAVQNALQGTNLDPNGNTSLNVGQQAVTGYGTGAQLDSAFHQGASERVDPEGRRSCRAPSPAAAGYCRGNGRPGRRRRVAGRLAAVAVRHQAEPARARLLGVLTADDLRPLVGKNGTMTAETKTSTLQPTPEATNGGYHCSLYWKDGPTKLYLGAGPMIALSTASDLRQTQAVDASTGKLRSLSFGAGNIAWEADTNVQWLNLAIPCTFRDPVSGQSSNGYARVWMDMAPNPGGPPTPTSEVRQADAGIVLKLAKAFTQQYPCGGDTLPPDAPSIPPYPGS